MRSLFAVISISFSLIIIIGALWIRLVPSKGFKEYEKQQELKRQEREKDSRK